MLKQTGLEQTDHALVHLVAAVEEPQLLVVLDVPEVEEGAVAIGARTATAEEDVAAELTHDRATACGALVDRATGVTVGILR